MSLPVVEPDQYQALLQAKHRRLQALLSPFAQTAVELFASPPLHYRMRAEFRYWHAGHHSFFAMTGADGQIVRVDNFPVACTRINELMGVLADQLRHHEMLRRNLFQVDFLAATTGDAVITLTYHRPVDDEWARQAAPLQQTLGCSLIGRSRGRKLVLGNDFVTEEFSVAGETFSQRQPESAFSQPNAAINTHMLAWAVQRCSGLGGDLLELYCGNGNFTLPLSRCFNKVLATEVSKASIQALEHNVQANGCTHIALARLSSEELTQALSGVRPFRRLAHVALAEYNFSTVLVDPPRAGLDPATLSLIAGFEHILYISCNPETLAANLQTLCQTHVVTHTALFDQFPYTEHLETGVFLQRKPS